MPTAQYLLPDAPGLFRTALADAFDARRSDPCPVGDTAAADHTLVNPRDVLMLQAARKLVLEDLTTVFTIDQLARHVGTNSAKLKAGFRVLFGCTVFELALKARMDAALEMLVAQRGAIADVAEAVGYRHASSFTTAFQQYFGFAPRDARRLGVPALASSSVSEPAQP